MKAGELQIGGDNWKKVCSQKNCMEYQPATRSRTKINKLLLKQFVYLCSRTKINKLLEEQKDSQVGGYQRIYPKTNLITGHYILREKFGGKQTLIQNNKKST